MSLALVAPLIAPASSAIAPPLAIMPGQHVDAFQVALDALEVTGADPDPLLHAQRAQVTGARMLLDGLPKLQGDDLQRAAAWAKLGERVQYETLGIRFEYLPTPSHATPSQAAHVLLERHGTKASGDAERALDAFDDLPKPVRDALTRTIDAFLGFEDASMAAFEHADGAKLDAARPLAERLQRGETLSADDLLHAPRLDDFGIRWGLVPPARDALLDAAVRLHDALNPMPAELLVTVPILDVPGVLHLDLTTADNMYTKDYALLIDAGGSDAYLNNAGGANGGDAHAYCHRVPLNVAAALLDFSGNDAFGDGRSCGSNGGADMGAGFLLHGVGNATYTAGWIGVNGGGFTGSGFLVDAGQDTSYVSLVQPPFLYSGIGANGGGDTGIGFLVDLAGNDIFEGGVGGVNGGGVIGAGMLLDGSGSDRYVAGSAGVNGGGDLGVGFLLDAGDGSNQFLAWGSEANGGSNIGVGLLVSGTGNDAYLTAGGSVNGGATYAGVGTLIDLGGDDTYVGGNYGTNGGNYEALFGLLLDAGGNDSYTAGVIGNGEGAAGCLVPFFLVCLIFAGGTAGLIDVGGHDWYADAHGSCYDCSAVPKGFVGMQVDVPR